MAIRYGWAGSNPLIQRDHDKEWEIPKRNEGCLFEDFVLDGAQAGLSRVTILRKRENYHEAFDTFDPIKVAAYLWAFVDGKPIQNAWQTMSELLAKTGLSEEISKGLKKRGFNFVGQTIIYAFMQAIGMFNERVTHCFRYGEVAERN